MIQSNQSTSQCPVCKATEAVDFCAYRCAHRPSRAVFADRRIVRCRGCSLLYTSPAPSLAELDSYYREVYRGDAFKDVVDLARFPFDHPAFLSRGRSLYKLVKEQLGDQASQPLKVLEIGAGNGRVLWPFKESSPHWTLFAAEPDADCQPLLEKCGAQVFNAFLSDAASMSKLTDAGPFDVVILAHVIEHLLDPVEALRLSASLLSADGVLVIEIPHSPDRETSWTPNHAPHLTFMTSHTLRDCIERSGGDIGFLDTCGPTLPGFLPFRGRWTTRLGMKLLPAAVRVRIRRMLNSRQSPPKQLANPDFVPISSFCDYGGEHRWALRAIIRYEKS